MIRLLIADEHPIVRQGLKLLLAETADITVVAEVDNGHEMVQAVPLHRPDIVLLDLCVKRHQVATFVESIRRSDSHVRFVIFTTFRGADEVALAFRAKIEGYVLKTEAPTDLIAAIRAVSQGSRWMSPLLAAQPNTEAISPSLTEREREVLSLIASGKTNQEAATTLFISEGTVKFHVNNILNKLGADDRTSAVVIALHRGLLRMAE